MGETTAAARSTPSCSCLMIILLDTLNTDIEKISDTIKKHGAKCKMLIALFRHSSPLVTIAPWQSANRPADLDQNPVIVEILRVPICNKVYRRVEHTHRYSMSILLHSRITMGCEKAQLLLKQLLGMLPSNYWCAILPNKHTNTCLSKVFGLSNFEVEALLFYANAGVCHARWGFSVSLTTWAKFHVHLEDEYSATDYYRMLFICKGPPFTKPHRSRSREGHTFLS